MKVSRLLKTAALSAALIVTAAAFNSINAQTRRDKVEDKIDRREDVRDRRENRRDRREDVKDHLGKARHPHT